jgi:hypothetical protein
MEKEDFFDRIKTLMKAHPKSIGILALLFGALLLAASIFNWEWMFEGRSYNLKKIEGMSNFFGRGFARVWLGAGGIGIIILGIVLTIVL